MGTMTKGFNASLANRSFFSSDIQALWRSTGAPNKGGVGLSRRFSTNIPLRDSTPGWLTIFSIDFPALWRSALSARVPESQK